MWIIHRNAVSDEQQDSIQQIENRFRSDGIEYPISIPKSMGFSQSLFRVRSGGDTILENQISAEFMYIVRLSGIHLKL